MNSFQKPHILNPQPYGGQSTKLVIGIDVGTSYSGVCYAFLRPGEVPEVQSVTRFTDQTSGDNKIPTIMYYDDNLKVQAAGATAISENVKHEAQFERWTRLQYFKMHMKPSDMPIDTHGLEIDLLPTDKNVTDVMGDFLSYLYDETMTFIEDSHTDGSDLLKEVENQTSFVLSLPNGWIGLPQQRMREAAIIGGLIEDSADGRAKIKFVSEGEASAISCITGGLCPPDLKEGYRFMIADAGGGTLDVTSYEVIQSSPLELKELTSSDCCFAGSVFVNKMGKKLLQNKLRGSAYGNREIIDEIVNGTFENSAKREFRDASKATWLRGVGDRNDRDANLGIRNGSLRLDGEELAGCFDFSITEALKSIKAQIANCGGKPMPVWLVGGFSASPWFFKRLKEELRRDGVVVSRPDIKLSKAVAHGSVLFSLEDIVTSRVTRNAYGVKCGVLYRPWDSEHCRRQHLRYTDLEGDDMISGQFSTIVDRNVDVNAKTRSSRSYSRLIERHQDAYLSCTVLSYDDEEPIPKWYDENKDKLSTACTIRADLSALCTPSTRKTHNGNTFWKLEYDIEISFGLTELQARVKWVEKGKTKYGPTTIFYEGDESLDPNDVPRAWF